MSNQKVITMLLPDGEPNGLKIIQLEGWVGKVLVVPRGKISKLFERPETQQPGVYFLFGESEDPNSKPPAYIGKSGIIRNRIQQQADDKDYWDTAVVFTGGLGGGDAQYLEKRCFDIAKTADRCKLRNSANPPGDMLDEAGQVRVESYLENIQFLISLLGFPIFQPIPQKNSSDAFYCKSEFADAKGALLESGEFIVYKGSIAERRERPALYDYTILLRKQLESEGVLEKKDENTLMFTRDYIFKTPSSASEVVKATPSSGWTSWVSESGITLKDAKERVK
ncbi:MAG: GIY-YIG nuclease family protein [Candidatus Taylorbacteria bacterium]|nr:GIY-YIG nuclease family protein [Candidatus Taylorbacteria bacterium]